MQELAINNIDQLPLVLQLDGAGNPHKWINYQDSCYYMAKDLIAWSMGSFEVPIRGGINAVSGKQSVLRMNTIVAVKQHNKSSDRYDIVMGKVPLTNRNLFARDLYTCAYCGTRYKEDDLSRDHIIPVSKGGPNSWMNCVASCNGCNKLKDDRSPEQAHMQLLYVPYVPVKSEHLIFSNRRILMDQMEFLMKRVPKHSRLHS